MSIYIKVYQITDIWLMLWVNYKSMKCDIDDFNNNNDNYNNDNNNNDNNNNKSNNNEI